MIIKGKALWVKGTVQQAEADYESTSARFGPNKTGPCYTMNLEVDEATAVDLQKKGATIKRDEKTGIPVIKLARPVRRKDPESGEERELSPPKCVDENLNPFDITKIGNGSPVLVDCWITSPKTKGYKKSIRWEGIQVDTRTMQVYGDRGFTKLTEAPSDEDVGFEDDGVPF